MVSPAVFSSTAIAAARDSAHSRTVADCGLAKRLKHFAALQISTSHFFQICLITVDETVVSTTELTQHSVIHCPILPPLPVFAIADNLGKRLHRVRKAEVKGKHVAKIADP